MFGEQFDFDSAQIKLVVLKEFMNKRTLENTLGTFVYDDDTSRVSQFHAERMTRKLEWSLRSSDEIIRTHQGILKQKISKRLTFFGT